MHSLRKPATRPLVHAPAGPPGVRSGGRKIAAAMIDMGAPRRIVQVLLTASVLELLRRGRRRRWRRRSAAGPGPRDSPQTAAQTTGGNPKTLSVRMLIVQVASSDETGRPAPYGAAPAA